MRRPSLRPALLSASAALLANAAMLPHTALAQTATEAATGALPAETPSDLPRNARPSHYSIHIVPDMEALTLGGSASIDLEVFEPSEAVTVHANELDILTAQMWPLAGGEAITLTATLDTEAQTASLAAADTIAPGQYRLDITYTGTIYTQANGLFALDYPDKRTGEEVRGLFTQFEAPDGRRFAPMFDEPSYKASFDLSATVPADLMAVGNMPIVSEEDLGDGTKLVNFGTTPVMSSYLLFFALGDFERATKLTSEGTEIGIVAPAGSGDQVNYALDSMAEMLPYFSEYFDMPYTLPKLDNVAGPGRSQFFSAMENWGAIFTFERLLLFDPSVSSDSVRQTTYEVAAHEVAHQWFGNIVTMAWWDDLWLNEGFASWMEAKVTSHFHPDWEQDFTRVSSREAAMNLDAFETTHPVVQEISTVSELGAAFDAIAYQKGMSVIGMFEAYAGEDVWRDGLRAYMKANQFDNTVNSDLWGAVEAAGAPGLTDIAADFIHQPGVPLVEVTSMTCENGQTMLGLVQSEFSRDRMDEVRADPQSWRVPLRIAVGDGEPVSQLLEGSASLTLDGCGPVTLNAGQHGYYRTLYAPEAQAVMTADFAQLAPIDQYGTMRDAISLSRAGYQPLAVGLDVLAAVPADAEGVLAESVINRWQEFYSVLEDETVRAKLAGQVSADWLPRLQALGFDPVEGEPIRDALLRANLIRALGSMGDATVTAEASSRFAALADDATALDGPLKTTWLGVVSRNASREEWELLRSLANTTNSAVEKEIYFSLLGNNADQEIAEEALALALTDEPGATFSASIIQTVAFSHPELTWDFVDANRERVESFVDGSGLARFYGDLLGGASTPEMLAKAEAYRDTLPEDQQIGVGRGIAALKERISSNAYQRDGLTEWLAAQ